MCKKTIANGTKTFGVKKLKIVSYRVMSPPQKMW